jgi:hypothetical protein
LAHVATVLAQQEDSVILATLILIARVAVALWLLMEAGKYAVICVVQ